MKKISKNLKKNFFGIPIWNQIGIPFLFFSQNSSKWSQTDLKKIWLDSLIFLTQDGREMGSFCCVKFGEKGLQKMAKSEIFDQKILVPKSKIWMRFGGFWSKFEIFEKFWADFGKILRKFFFWNTDLKSDRYSIFVFRQKLPQNKTKGPQKILGGSLIFSTQIHAWFASTCCVKFWDKRVQKMEKFEFFEKLIWIDQWKIFNVQPKIFDFSHETFRVLKCVV